MKQKDRKLKRMILIVLLTLVCLAVPLIIAYWVSVLQRRTETYCPAGTHKAFIADVGNECISDKSIIVPK